MKIYSRSITYYQFQAEEKLKRLAESSTEDSQGEDAISPYKSARVEGVNAVSPQFSSLDEDNLSAANREVDGSIEEEAGPSPPLSPSLRKPGILKTSEHDSIQLPTRSVHCMFNYNYFVNVIKVVIISLAVIIFYILLTF